MCRSTFATPVGRNLCIPARFSTRLGLTTRSCRASISPAVSAAIGTSQQVGHSSTSIRTVSSRTRRSYAAAAVFETTHMRCFLISPSSPTGLFLQAAALRIHIAALGAAAGAAVKVLSSADHAADGFRAVATCTDLSVGACVHARQPSALQPARE